MADYTELAKALRLCSKDEGCFKDCPYYEKCFSSNGHINFCVMQEAADAIEQLQKSTCPHYIRNVHDSGDDSLCDKYKCEANALPRWIPVKERLPEDFKAVLVYTPKFINQFMAYRKDDGWRVWSPQDNHGVPFINGQGEITHWMPLPEPPKEVQT